MPDQPTQPLRILWAVDPFDGPFEGTPGPQSHAAQIIRQLQRRGEVRVFPVHVLSPAELNLSAEYVGPWVGQYQPSAEKGMRRLITELTLENIEEPRILTESAVSTSHAAEALIAYAKSMQADVILVGTHGRTGVARWLLGSFAETLLTRSDVPVLVAGPHPRADVDLRELVFATDLGEGSEHVFRQVVAFARKAGASVTLFHSIPLPVEPLVQSGPYLVSSPWVPLDAFFERERERQTRHLNAWARWASHQGVIAEAVVEAPEPELRVHEAILALARKRNAGWIAMASNSGPVASALLGSITRKIVRASECPVWVVRRSHGQAGYEPQPQVA